MFDALLELLARDAVVFEEFEDAFEVFSDFAAEFSRLPSFDVFALLPDGGLATDDPDCEFEEFLSFDCEEESSESSA